MVGLIGVGEWNKLCTLRVLPDIRSQYGAAHTEAYLRIRSRCLAPMPGAGELIEVATRLGLVVALASNSPLESARHALESLGVLQTFTALATGDQVERGKPSADVHLLAMRRLGLSAEEALAIEDSSVGLRAATAAGLRCVVVPNSVTDGQDFAGAFRRFESLHEVATWLADGAAPTRDR